MRNNIIKVFIFIVAFIVSISVFGYEIQLQDKWLIYQKKENIYKPLLAVDRDFQTITTFVSKKWSNYYLLFESREGLCLYVNDKFHAYYSNEGKSISVSLRELFAFYHEDSLKITFYHQHGDLPILSKLSDVSTNIFSQKAIANKQHTLLKRYYNEYYDSWLICLLISFGMFLYFRLSYKTAFKDFYTKLLSKDINYTLPNTLLLLLLVATSWNLALQSYFLESFTVLNYHFYGREDSSALNWNSIFNWVILFFAYILIKIVIISIVNLVLDLKLKQIHYYEMFRGLFSLSIIGVAYLFFTSLFYVSKNYIVFFLENIPLISFIYITLIVLMQLSKLRYFKLLYLFLYICTTELIPFFIFNKIIDSNT